MHFLFKNGQSQVVVLISFHSKCFEIKESPVWMKSLILVTNFTIQLNLNIADSVF